ncbi:MAG: IS66 family insertion sequence element accessory protein TnpB [Rhodovulum sp.]|nr:IS66 family insertion sequence element accessory protein TnpB [Rhodovulum sp.]
MIGPGTGVRVYLACGATDMRKGIAGLAAPVQAALRRKPKSGAHRQPAPTGRSFSSAVRSVAYLPVARALARGNLSTLRVEGPGRVETITLHDTPSFWCMLNNSCPRGDCFEWV